MSSFAVQQMERWRQSLEKQALFSLEIKLLDCRTTLKGLLVTVSNRETEEE